MRTFILAALAALLVIASSPAKASFTQDDRYFDSWANAKPVSTSKVRTAAYKKKVAPRRASRRWRSHEPVPVPRSRPGTVRDYAPAINSGATFPTVTRAVILGGRPAGCPRAFCGCGASLHLFGRIIPFLNLAANWLRFPRAAPAPGMAAARRGHVFVLKQHIEGRKWLVYDANSGRRLTRMHPRSIAGYTIVNPRAGPS